MFWLMFFGSLRRLHHGLYYANAVEWAASAMEMAVIGARNCANAAHAHWARLHGPGGSRCVLEDDDEEEDVVMEEGGDHVAAEEGEKEEL